MSRIKSFIYGIYPRSNTLAQLTRDVGRKRATREQLEKQQEADFNGLLALQNEQGFTYIEDGKLPWQDIFRPLVEATNGLTVGPLTRWFDNNSFFRQPIINGKLTLDAKKLDSYFPTITPTSAWKVMLPSPFLFAKLSHGNGFSFEEKLNQTTKIINILIDSLEKKGVTFVQLNEPAIPYYGVAKKEISLFLKSLETIKQSNKKIKIAVHFYFGDCAPIVSAINNTAVVDVVGIDFYKTSLSSLPKNISFNLIIGIIETRNSLIEKESTLKTFVNKLRKTYTSQAIYLTHNSELELLPQAVAKEKVRLLGRIQKYFQT